MDWDDHIQVVLFRASYLISLMILYPELFVVFMCLVIAEKVPGCIGSEKGVIEFLNSKGEYLGRELKIVLFWLEWGPSLE